MKLDIAVCDDVKADLDFIADCLKDVCADMDITAHINLFSSGEAFLSAAAEKNYNIVFMDIYMNGISGIEAVRACVGKGCRFIFTSVSSEHTLEAFSLNAAHYLMKPVSREAVTEALKRCIVVPAEKPVKTLCIKTGRKNVHIPMESILYIEVRDKICEVHTEKEIYRTYTSLGALFELLDGDIFIRAQQSFAVNMYFIVALYYDSVLLRDGTEIALSRRHSGKIKERYRDFLFRMARGESV